MQVGGGRRRTRSTEAAVHVGTVPGLHGAVHGRQGAERSLGRRRRHGDDGLLLPVLVLMVKPRPQAWTNDAGLWAGHCRQMKQVCEAAVGGAWRCGVEVCGVEVHA